MNLFDMCFLYSMEIKNEVKKWNEKVSSVMIFGIP